MMMGQRMGSLKEGGELPPQEIERGGKLPAKKTFTGRRG